MNKSVSLMIVLALATIIVAPAFAQDADRELFLEAERRFSAGDYALALDRYERLVQRFPSSRYLADSQYRIGLSLYQLGSLEEADERLERVATRYRSTQYLPYVPFWRGLIAYSQSEFEQSRELLLEFLESPSGLPDEESEHQAWFTAGLAAQGLGDEDATISGLESLFASGALPEENGYATAVLLSLYAKQGEAEALLSFLETVDRSGFPSDYLPHLTLYEAEALYIAGEREAAVAGYRESESAPAELATLAFQRLFQLARSGVIADEPDAVLRRAERILGDRTDVLTEFWLRVGIDAFADESYQVSELYFQRIWDLRGQEEIPSSVALYLSRLLDRRGEPGRAESVLSEYLELDTEASEEIRVLIALGNLRVRLGRAEEAIAPLSTGLEKAAGGPLEASAVYQLAFAEQARGNPSSALRILDTIPATGSELEPEILRLRSVSLQRLGRLEEALQSLFSYLPQRPADADAAVEYARLLFELDRNDRVVDEAPTIIEVLHNADSLGAGTEADLRYVLGLSLINQVRYEEAARQMEAVVSLVTGDPSRAEAGELALFYQGWSLYRSGAYRDAYDALVRFRSDFAASDRAAEAAYLAGWSAFFATDYTQAEQSLALVTSADSALERASEFLLGRVLSAQSRYQEAAVTFRTLYLDHPLSGLADDARFEYAEMQVLLGQTDAASAGFADLVSAHPQSPLVEPATFRRADVLFAADRFRDAQVAYFTYRTEFPEGPQVDAALFWGGVASSRLGEEAGATLLWERLANEFAQSSFRSEALRRAAESHASRENYRQALNLYTEFRAAYPDEAQAARVDREIDELVLLLNGLTEREAELYVTIENADGAQTANGRQAIIELGRLAIYEDTAAATDGAEVIPLLESVADLGTEHPLIASQALFLIAEYLNREEELLQAAELYLRAASLGASDRDLAALSLFRAASMYSARGRSSEVNALLDQLEEQFPASEWLEEARTLRGGNNE